MAYANWLIPDKTSGSGNGTVNVSATQNTGRNARSTTVTFKAGNVQDIQRNVSQAGRPEFVDVADTASASKNGQTVEIKGTSNSSRLSFEQGSIDGASISFTLDIPDTYIANSLTIENGETITGDPGATALYEFSILVGVPSNSGITDLKAQLIVRADNEQIDTCTITLAAGDAYIRVTPSSISLPWTGEAAEFAVESNTNWSIY